MAISNDYGQNWVNPNIVPFGGTTPDISPAGAVSSPRPSLTTNLGGKYIYVSWYVGFAIPPFHTTIQEVNGINTLAQLPQLQGNQVKNRFPLAIELANKIGWNYDPNAVKYLIYSDATLTHLIAEVYPPNLEFIDHQIKKCETKTYYVTWVDMNGNVSIPSSITLP